MQEVSSDLWNPQRACGYLAAAMEPAREPTGAEFIKVRLKTTRLALKLTPTRIYKLTGVSQQNWHNAEVQGVRIGIDTAIKLCQGLGITLDWIYRGRLAGMPHEIVEAIRAVETQPNDKKSKRA